MLLNKSLRIPLTAARAVEVLKVSDPTARKIIGQLTDVGLLTAAGEREYGRSHVAGSILRIIEGD